MIKDVLRILWKMESMLNLAMRVEIYRETQTFVQHNVRDMVRHVIKRKKAKARTFVGSCCYCLVLVRVRVFVFLFLFLFVLAYVWEWATSRLCVFGVCVILAVHPGQPTHAPAPPPLLPPPVPPSAAFQSVSHMAAGY